MPLEVDRLEGAGLVAVGVAVIGIVLGVEVGAHDDVSLEG